MSAEPAEWTDDGPLSPEWLEGYEHGVVHGIARGRADLEAEWSESYETAARVARMVAAAPSYAELCDRRGEPERAARARRTLAERGIWPVPREAS